MSRPADLLSGGAKDLLDQLTDQYKEELARRALSQALSEGHDTADEAYVRQAVIEDTSDETRAKWALRIALGTLTGLVGIDLATLRSEQVINLPWSTQAGLWILPSVLVPWLLALSYILREDLR